MKSTRSLSDPHENYIRRRFRESGIDFKMKDKSSGSARADGDGMSRDFFLSCKYRTSKGFSISGRDYKKDVQQADRFRKKPLWAIRNEDGQDMIMLYLEDFLRIIKDTETMKDYEDD